MDYWRYRWGFFTRGTIGLVRLRGLERKGSWTMHSVATAESGSQLVAPINMASNTRTLTIANHA